MSDPSVSKLTPVGVVRQFQQANEKAACSSASLETVEYALQDFCQRMCSGRTLEALGKVHAFPAGIEFVMIRFLAYLRQCTTVPTSLTATKQLVVQNITRHLKAMEIYTPFLKMCSRSFTWLNRGTSTPGHNQIPNAKNFHDEAVKWVGKAHRQVATEPKSLIDDGVLTIFSLKSKVFDTESFFWRLKLSEDGLIISAGFEPTQQLAADALYKAFYKALTKKRTVDASQVKEGTVLVILGNWITNDEYMAYKNKANLQIVSDASDDTRDDLMFVIGWPVLGKQKAKVTAYKVDKARTWGDANSENVVIKLRSGFTIDATLDWYVLHIEQFVLGEIMCQQCKMVGDVQNMGCINVRGQGLLCGPCIDHLIDKGLVDDDAFDSMEIQIPQTLVRTSEEEFA